MFAEEKYKESVYIIVSVEPIRILADLACGLSGPTSANNLSATAVTALPEKGRRIIEGNNSPDMPILKAIGSKKVHKTSTAPLAKTQFTAHIINRSVGSKAAHCFIPSSAPLKKLCNRLCFLKNTSETETSTNGRIQELK
jgi:hypothetical protein